MRGSGLAEPKCATGMIKSKHRREYLVDRISSSLQDAEERPSEAEATGAAGTGRRASYPAQVLLAAVLLLGFLAIPLGILYLMLN